MAKKFAYAEPVLSAPSRSNTMKPGARDTALSQATLAAQRLANMLNEAFQVGHR
jgi:hypothetical protein